MRMKDMITIASASAVALLTLSACDIKDPIYNTPHPDYGKITLATDWSERTAGVAIPDSYTVCIGEHVETLSGVKNIVDYRFEPSSYLCLAYNAAEHMAVNGTVASVAETTTGSGAGRCVNSMPGWFFSGTENMTIEADREYEYTVRMQQQVRLLTLVLELNGGTAARVTGIEGYLSGVASTLDISSGEHGAPAGVKLVFAKDADGKYRATARLLGVAGGEQKLTATVDFENGTPETMPIESDLSKVLAGFNADKKTPMTLGGEAVETPTPAGFTATIDDWTVISGGSVVAD